MRNILLMTAGLLALCLGWGIYLSHSQAEAASVKTACAVNVGCVIKWNMTGGTIHVQPVGYDEWGNIVDDGPKRGRSCVGPKYAICRYTETFAPKPGVSWSGAHFSDSRGGAIVTYQEIACQPPEHKHL